MVYCTNCGEKTADDANFCSKCGAKTAKGKASKVLYPSDQFTDAFYSVGVELERAFTIAAQETHAAIQRATGNVQQKPADQQAVVCPKCGSKNAVGSVFCVNCGSRIVPVEESHGGA